MPEPEPAPVRRNPLHGYRLALVATGLFVVLGVMDGRFPPFPWFILVAALTVLGALSGKGPPRLQAHFLAWILPVALVAIGVAAFATVPEEVNPNDGPPCKDTEVEAPPDSDSGWVETVGATMDAEGETTIEYGVIDCRELFEWWGEHAYDRHRYQEGIGLLGAASFVAVLVLIARRPWAGAGFARGTSIVLLSAYGLVLLFFLVMVNSDCGR